MAKITSTDDLPLPADDKKEIWNPAGARPGETPPDQPLPDADAADDDLAELEAMLTAIADSKDDETELETINLEDWSR